MPSRWLHPRAVVLRIVQLRDVHALEPLRAGVDRHGRVLAVLERDHAPAVPLLELIDREVAVGNRDHPVERVGRAGPHQVGELLLDDVDSR